MSHEAHNRTCVNPTQNAGNIEFGTQMSKETIMLNEISVSCRPTKCLISVSNAAGTKVYILKMSATKGYK